MLRKSGLLLTLPFHSLISISIYTFFESFPIVFYEGYGWSLGVSTLPFAGIMIGEAISFGLYCLWNRWVAETKGLDNSC